MMDVENNQEPRQRSHETRKLIEPKLKFPNLKISRQNLNPTYKNNLEPRKQKKIYSNFNSIQDHYKKTAQASQKFYMKSCKNIPKKSIDLRRRKSNNRLFNKSCYGTPDGKFKKSDILNEADNINLSALSQKINSGKKRKYRRRGSTSGNRSIFQISKKEKYSFNRLKSGTPKDTRDEETKELDRLVGFYKREKEILDDVGSKRSIKIKKQKGVVPLKKMRKDEKFNFFSTKKSIKKNARQMMNTPKNQIEDPSKISQSLKEKFWETLAIEEFKNGKNLLGTKFEEFEQKIIQSKDLYPELNRLNTDEKIDALLQYLRPKFVKITKQINFLSKGDQPSMDDLDQTGALVKSALIKLKNFMKKKVYEILDEVNTKFKDIFNFSNTFTEELEKLGSVLCKKKVENIYLGFSGVKNHNVFTEQGLPRVPIWENYCEKIKLYVYFFLKF